MKPEIHTFLSTLADFTYCYSAITFGGKRFHFCLQRVFDVWDNKALELEKSLTPQARGESIRPPRARSWGTGCRPWGGWEGEKRTLWAGWRRELWEDPVCKLDPCATRAVWKVKVAQSCPTLCYPMHYTVHGILHTGVGSLSLLQGIFPTQGSNPGPLHSAGGFFFFTSWAIREARAVWKAWPKP